jgi:hypothetical protein
VLRCDRKPLADKLIVRIVSGRRQRSKTKLATT